jgi:hypothetical protein
MDIPADIVFSESYVLGLSVEPYLVRLLMDFVLAPEHPSYAHPRVNEQECYRRGEIRVRGFRRVTWDARGILPSHDSSGEFDFGNLQEPRRVGDPLRLSGDWGTISIVGGEFHIELFD